MFRTALAISALLAALPASAQEPGAISLDIAENGLAAAETRIAPDDDALGLGAVRFLRAIERTLQTRWQAGMTADLMGIPVLRLPVPDNPEPVADPEAITRIFEELLVDLTAANEAFDAAGPDAALTLDLGDLWFDVNMSGTREPGEGVAEVAGMLFMRGGPDIPPVVRFDHADAAWASAYAHLLSGVSELILAFDPATQVARVGETARTLDALGAPSPYVNALDMQFSREVDLAAIIYFAVQTQPDAARIARARTHFLDMIADNRLFWSRVAEETDNAAEWIPNDRQSSATGMDFPHGLGDQWAAVLDDGEALLNGEKLIPHWRMRSGAGINLKKLMENPPPVDVAEWAHGVGLVPYAEAGERVNSASLRAFEELVGGDALFYMIVVN